MLLDSILPRACALCQKLGEDLCPECENKLRRIDPDNACTICGKPFAGESPSHPCSACLEDPPCYESHRSLFVFEDNIKGLIHQLKYKGQFWIKRVLKEEVKRLAFTEASAMQAGGRGLDVDVILPVPLHINRLRQRGFNQSLILAELWGLLLDKPVFKEVIERVADTPSQTGLSKEQRQRNLKDAFRVVNALKIKGQRILLVDDVHTTGVTLSSAARVLKKAGVQSVDCVTLAFVERN